MLHLMIKNQKVYKTMINTNCKLIVDKSSINESSQIERDEIYSRLTEQITLSSNNFHEFGRSLSKLLRDRIHDIANTITTEILILGVAGLNDALFPTPQSLTTLISYLKVDDYFSNFFVLSGNKIDDSLEKDVNNMSNTELDDVKAKATKAKATKAKATKAKATKAKTTKAKTTKAKADEVKADEVKADEVKADEVKADEVKADEVKNSPLYESDDSLNNLVEDASNPFADLTADSYKTTDLDLPPTFLNKKKSVQSEETLIKIPNAEPTFSQPAEPTFSQPTEPTFSQPAEPTFSQPAEPTFSQPAEPTFSQPAEPTFTQPTEPDLSQDDIEFLNTFTANVSNTFPTNDNYEQPILKSNYPITQFNQPIIERISNYLKDVPEVDRLATKESIIFSLIDENYQHRNMLTAQYQLITDLEFQQAFNVPVIERLAILDFILHI